MIKHLLEEGLNAELDLHMKEEHSKGIKDNN